MGQATEEEATESTVNGKYRQVFGIKAVHLLAIFTLVYVGVEVTIGGEQSWFPVSFLAFRSNWYINLGRLDCHFHCECSTRWTVLWIYFLRVLWRFVYMLLA